MTDQIAMPWACYTIAEAARHLGVSPGRMARACRRIGMTVGRSNGIEVSRLEEMQQALRLARQRSTGRRSAVTWSEPGRPSP